MSIRAYLNGQQFDAETIRIMGVAFEMTRAALRVDGIDDRVASKIIDLAKAGECDPNEVCERALAALRRGTAADRLGDQTVHLGLPSFPSET